MVDDFGKCPECGSEMTIVKGADTFDGPVPDRFVCNECGHQENI